MKEVEHQDINHSGRSESSEAPNDYHYQRALEMLRAEQVSLYEAREELAELPFCQNRMRDEWDEVIDRVSAADEALSKVGQYIIATIGEGNGLKDYAGIDALILNEGIARRLDLSLRTYQIAACHFAVMACALGFQEDAPEFKPMHKKSLLYFGTVHELLVGVKTNVSLFLRDPEKQALDLLDGVVVLIEGFSERELKEASLQHILDGGEVSYVHRIDSQDFQVLSGKSETL